jgi:hypothetical protein
MRCGSAPRAGLGCSRAVVCLLAQVSVFAHKNGAALQQDYGIRGEGLLYILTMSSSEKNSKPEPDIQYEPKTRKCLKCRDEFLSSWPGERICRTCKSSSAWREGIAA